ncbi:MAG: glycosyltransferase family 39 protein [Patescibacteria group bacterium]|nr:glycosyltransferase family 39 protein [Patescibacteria group bacterium]MDE2590227.1 glycosyltransferase family 39 protein [Patescibacteria group bacterium]
MKIPIVLFVIDVFLFLLFAINHRFPFASLLLYMCVIIFLLYFIFSPYLHFKLFQRHAKDIVIVISIFLLALGVYIYRLDQTPPGLFLDEYAIGLDAFHLTTLHEYVPWVNWSTGHPTAIFYLLSSSLNLFGHTVFAIRFPFVLFGALSVVVFYILLRLFFTRLVSSVGTVLFLCSYQMIINSRLAATEITPMLFCEILTLLFLYLSYKTKDLRYFAAIGLSIGAGFNTYLGFRSFAFTAFLITVYLLFSKTPRQNFRKSLQNLFVFLMGIFTLTVPLLAYSTLHVQQLLLHTTQLSVFNKGLSGGAIVSLVLWNVSQLPHLFSPPGDPFFVYNPASTSLYDIGTFILLILGCVFLFRENKQLLFAFIILLLPFIGNDILSTYDLPNAVHNSGIVGHPNTLHLSGLIPLIYFVCAYGLSKIRVSLKINNTKVPAVIFIVLFVAMYNWYLYFMTPINNKFYSQTTTKLLTISTIINYYHPRVVFLPPSLVDSPKMSIYSNGFLIPNVSNLVTQEEAFLNVDPSISFFTNVPLEQVEFDPSSVDEVISGSAIGDLVVIDWDLNPSLSKVLWERVQSHPELFRGEVLREPNGKIDYFVFGKIFDNVIL